MSKDVENVKSFNGFFAYILLLRFAFRNLQDSVMIFLQEFAFELLCVGWISRNQLEISFSEKVLGVLVDTKLDTTDPTALCLCGEEC